MAKSISVKELRTKFPKIRRQLENGESFELIYRSKPIADLTPKRFKPTPKEAFAFFANPPKEWLLSGNEDAVTTIRRERGTL